jgi:quinol monooxygenase YgiN
MNQKPVYVFAKWQVKEGQLDNVLKFLADAVKQSTQEEGNLFYKAHQSNSEPDTIVLFEGYVDSAALDTHRNSEHFKAVVVEKIVPLLEHREVIITSRILGE